MPELPEVENVVRGLRSRILGQEVNRIIFLSPHLRKQQPLKARILDYFRGKRITDIRRRGKMIMVHFDGQLSWLIHLKMTGQLYLAPKNQPLDKHVHARVLFQSLKEELRFRDVRKFGFWLCLEGQLLEKKISGLLGPEPLELKFKDFLGLLRKHPSRLIKSLLLDQKIIAGIGNIYSDEMLFRARIRPDRRVESLTNEEIRKLHRAMRLVLKEAIALKGSSISDYVDADGEKGHFQEKHRVYGRAGLSCRRCRAGLIRRQKVAGRSTYFCPVCQK
ncbi:MAG: bifunctional DNA-formamidopyrimidine glycosylase/DNA-(apurinic or apyrimidinic site) lyase [Candidatus Saccharicenans sp.]